MARNKSLVPSLGSCWRAALERHGSGIYYSESAKDFHIDWLLSRAEPQAPHLSESGDSSDLPGQPALGGLIDVIAIIHLGFLLSEASARSIVR